MKAIVASLVLCVACSTEKLPPVVSVHHSTGAPLRRVAVIPTDCDTSTIPQARQGYFGYANGEYRWNQTRDTDSRTTCRMLHEIVIVELSFRGAQIVDLSRVNVEERRRTTELTDNRQVVRVQGATLAEADVWMQRRWIAELGVDAIVRVRTIELPVKPRRTLAIVRVTRPADAELVWSSSCEMEHGALDDAPEAAEHAVRCALRAGLQ